MGFVFVPRRTSNFDVHTPIDLWPPVQSDSEEEEAAEEDVEEEEAEEEDREEKGNRAKRRKA